MKKIIFSIFILVAGFITVSYAEASSVILKPNVVTVQTGIIFTVPITVDGENNRQYTAGVSIYFPPDFLEVTSFAFAPNWLPLSQPGYDSLNNKIGELIKTGGFAGGFSGPVPFGTITFRAKAIGQANITVSPQSFILDAENKNTLLSRSQVRITIAAAKTPAPKVSPAKPSTNPPAPEDIPVITSDQSPPVISNPIPDLPSTGETTSPATLASEPSTTRPTPPYLIYIFIAAVLLGLAGWFISAKRRGSSG